MYQAKHSSGLEYALPGQMAPWQVGKVGLAGPSHMRRPAHARLTVRVVMRRISIGTGSIGAAAEPAWAVGRFKCRRLGGCRGCAEGQSMGATCGLGRLLALDSLLDSDGCK